MIRIRQDSSWHLQCGLPRAEKLSPVIRRGDNRGESRFCWPLVCTGEGEETFRKRSSTESPGETKNKSARVFGVMPATQRQIVLGWGGETYPKRVP